MKNPHSHSQWIKPLSVSLFSVAIVGLFPWELVAQAPASDLKRPSAAAPAKTRRPAANKAAPGAATTRPALATFSAGKFKVVVDGLRRAKGERTVSLKESGIPIAASFLAGQKGAGSAHGSSSWSSGSGGSDGYSASGGSSGPGASGGSGGSVAGGGSGASGGSGAAGASGKRWGYVSAGGAGGASGGWSAGSGGSAGAGGRGGSGGSAGYGAGGSGGAGAGGWSSGGSASGGGGTGFSAAGGSGGSGTGGWSSGGGAGAGSGGSGVGGGSGGSGWSAGGGAGSGDVGTANLVIDLHVSGPKNSPNQLLCAVVGKVQARDDLGNTIDAPDLPAHLRMELSGVDYPQGSGAAAVHLNLKNEQAKSIKSLQGDLVVMDARVQTTAFQGKELDRTSSRLLKGITVRLGKVEFAEDGIKVSAGVSMPNPFTDKLNFHNMQNRLRVVLEDSEGKTHTPRSASGGGGGGGGGSGGGWSSPRGGGGFSSGGAAGGGRAGGGRETLPLASYNLQFAPLPQGVTIKRIVCTVTELLSEPQRVTFRFSDLPLP